MIDPRSTASIQAISPLEAFTAGYLFGTGVPLPHSLAVAGRWQASAPGRDLVRQLEAFMDDEATAVKFYTELLRDAKEEDLGERAVDFIKHARDDEETHIRLFSDLYRSLTGGTYEPRAKEVRYASLREGVAMALADELEAAEEYRTVYLRETDRRVRNIFFETMTDEMEHATRFSFVHQFAMEEEES